MSGDPGLIRKGRAQRTAVCVLLACLCPGALALDPALDTSQYAHTTWRTREGFPKSIVSAFAQTPDGYLWLGTEFGLVHFDGVRHVAWQPPAGESLPDNRVRTLLAARDGTLWIGTWAGLASWNGGRLTTYRELAGRAVDSLVEDRDGVVWVGSQSADRPGWLCAIRRGSLQCYGQDGSFGPFVASLYEDSQGRLWAATSTGLWRWRPDPPRRYPLPPVRSLQILTEGARGAMLVATRGGVRQIVDEKVEAFPLSSAPSQVLRDRDGALWFGTYDTGLLHVHQGRTDIFTRSNGLSSDPVSGLFEDREGNIWVATFDGLDRFREFAAATYTVDQGLSQGSVVSVLAARDSSVWVSSLSGLNRWSNGQITAYRTRHPHSPKAPSFGSAQVHAAREMIVDGLPEIAASLFQDRRGRIWIGAYTGLGYLENNRFVSVSGVPTGFIDSITEDGRGDVWVAHRELGLLRVSSDRSFEPISWGRLGDRGPARGLAADPFQGGLWLGFQRGGIAYVVDGQVRTSYAASDGLGKGPVAQLRFDRGGALWVATEGGLSRLKNGHIATLNHTSGLPCDRIVSMIEDGIDGIWLYTGCGLVRIARSELDAWSAAVDRGQGTQGLIRTRVLDDSDGIRSFGSLSTFSPTAAKASDGRLWLVTINGVAVVDPRRLRANTLPPPVHVEQVIADRETYPALSHVHLPPLIRDLQIDYTALSLVAPEKVQFRYKLEGRDRDWQDAGNRRQAFYSDLAPGNYRFRVMASNNSGVWNEQGASLDFSIAPAYWQTDWFRALCVAGLFALLWLAYWLRTRQLARHFNRTLEARVEERTRIARELHDTLLQSFQGLLLRFQTAYELFRTRPAEAQQILGTAIDRAAEAITEGRDAVQALRSSAIEGNDLAPAIRTFGQELAAEEAGHDCASLSVVVEGAARPVHPILRDEIYRIASEALRNAFRHAQAKQIEVELHYDDRQLRLRVRDDGKGIDPRFLSDQGREGHFGLQGMRERAKLMGGKLTVWSAPHSGAEIELSIPASRAYAAPAATRRSWFAERLSGKITQSEL